MKAFLTITIFLISASFAHATVGGPSHIGYFKYNKTDESIYYILSDGGGRGCPPILNKLSLTTKKVTTELSCSEGEQLREDEYANNGIVLTEIYRRMENMKDLTPISLPANKIEIDLKFVNSEKMEPGEDWIIKSNFMATVYQNGVKIDEFPISGCNLEQPFIFGGYAIPGFEKKIAILASRKSDCFEGGYTGESLHIVSNMLSINRNWSTSQHKDFRSALVPSEATLVIFEKDTIVPRVPTNTVSPTPTSPSPTPTSPEPTDKNTWPVSTVVLALLLAAVIGLFLGRVSWKK